MPNSFFREVREVFNGDEPFADASAPGGSRLKRGALLVRELCRNLRADQIFTVAGALSYKTLVALVPVLAICLSVVAMLESPAGAPAPVAAAVAVKTIDNAMPSSAPTDAKASAIVPGADKSILTMDAAPEASTPDAKAASVAATGDAASGGSSDGGTVEAISRHLRVEARRSFLDALLERVPDFAGKAEFAASVERFADNARAIAGVSFVLLFWTVYSLLGSIEDTLNAIWRVNARRSFLKRLSAYLCTVLVVPVLLTLSVAISVYLASTVKVDSGFLRGAASFAGSLLVTVAAVTALYRFLPNTPVRLRSALLGGALGGVALELAKTAFQVFAFYVGGNYTKIYGPLLAFPFVLLWLWWLWVVVLAGAEVSFVAQNFTDLAARAELEKRGVHGRLYLAVRTVLAAAVHHRRGSVPENLAEEVACAQGLPPYLARRMLTDLLDCGMLREVVPGAGASCLPGKDISVLTLAEVVDAVSGDKLEVPPPPAGRTSVACESIGQSPTDFAADPVRERLAAVFAQAYTLGHQPLQNVTFAQLVDMVALENGRGEV